MYVGLKVCILVENRENIIRINKLINDKNIIIRINIVINDKNTHSLRMTVHNYIINNYASQTSNINHAMTDCIPIPTPGGQNPTVSIRSMNHQKRGGGDTVESLTRYASGKIKMASIVGDIHYSYTLH